MTSPLAGQLEALIERATAEELPTLAGALATALASVLARVSTPAAGPTLSRPHTTSDGLLDVQQAAERLGVAPTWLYRHASKLPFTRKLGHKTLRFDARGLDRWAATRATSHA